MAAGSISYGEVRVNNAGESECSYVLQADMMGHVSPVQNSDTVLYCRLIRLKNVVAMEEKKEEACFIFQNVSVEMFS